MKIINKGIIESTKTAENNQPPRKAVNYINPETMELYGKGTTIYTLWALLIPISIYCFKYWQVHEFIMMFSILGIGLGLLILLPKELIRVPLFPRKAEIFMYQMIKPARFFITTNVIMGKWRYVFICLIPYIMLGLLPLLIYIHLEPTCYLAKTLFSFGFISLASGGNDYMRAFKTIIKVPPFAKLWFNGRKVYFFYPERTV